MKRDHATGREADSSRPADEEDGALVSKHSQDATQLGDRAEPTGLHLAVGSPATGLPAEAAQGAGRRSSPWPLPPDRTQAILEATKHVAARLKSGGHPFALVGSVAAYAHGVPASFQHDVDFCILREDAEAVTQELEAAGVEVRTPPEDWLIKARSHGEEIDLIFELAQRPVTHELLDRAEILPVDSVRMPVLSPTDLVSSLMAAFSEHHCDFGAVLPIARTLREKIDWDRLRRDYEDAPMPDAFLYLLERLEIIDERGTDTEQGDEDS